jgi:glycoside/pentoside/hexuronide:cation symporter, GPH family
LKKSLTFAFCLFTFASMKEILRPSRAAIFIYALGQFGWSLASYAAYNLLTYFYMPPEESGKTVFPNFIFQGAVLGVFTLIGLIGFFGRFYDGVLDALIANWSDRRKTDGAKRRRPMGWAALPFALFGAMIFFPVSHELNSANGWFLFAILCLFYFFFSLYTVPYTALIAELGHDERDRMPISMALSIAWAVGFLIGAQIYPFQSALEARGFDSISAFQYVVGGFSVVATLAMLAPVFFLNEKKYALQTETTTNLRANLGTITSNRNFRWFVASDLMYWLSLTFIQTGVSYYITLLLGFEKSRAGAFLMLSGLGSFILYAPVLWLVRRFGKKRVILAAFWVFLLDFALVSMLDKLPISKEILFYLLAILAAFPLSAFGIIPNAIISDIIFSEEKQSGQQLSGMFFAARAFMMKVGISLANLLFPSLLLLGKSSENPFGVRVSAVCAVVFCFLGMLFFRKYEEE